MNKDQLQQELLKKLKPGIKPSDLKKPPEQNSQNNFTPQPNIKTIRSETLLKKDPNEDQIKQLQQAVNY
jgi:hypothetical protein